MSKTGKAAVSTIGIALTLFIVAITYVASIDVVTGGENQNTVDQRPSDQTPNGENDDDDDDCPMPEVEKVELTLDEQHAESEAIAFERMLPNRILPIPNSHPQLPVTGNSPFPVETSTATYDLRSESERYLQKLPSNVKRVTIEREGKTISVPVLKDGSELEVHVDHPRVQPRAQRSKHYRLYVANAANLPATTPGLKCETDAKIETPAITAQPSARAVECKVKSLINTKNFLPEIRSRDRLFVTYVQTSPAMFPETDPFLNPPGTNMLPTVYQNMRDRYGNEMPNTLPSHPNRPYNLHQDTPKVSKLKTQLSPTDDLHSILDGMFELVTEVPARRLWESLESTSVEEIMENTGPNHAANIRENRKLLLHYANWAIDMLEGNGGENSKVPSNRSYRGFALLHHSGHKPQSEGGRLNRVQPVFDKAGNVVAGHTEVRQVWYDGRIESDTMFFDFGWDDEYEDEASSEDAREIPRTGGPAAQRKLFAPQQADEGKLSKEARRRSQKKRQRPARIPPHVPWTVTYTIDVLTRGEDDFSPTQVYFDELERIDKDGITKVPAGRIFNQPRDADEFKELDNPHPELKTIYEDQEGKNVPVRFGPPHVAMDQTFFPLQEGTRTEITLKMAPPKNSNVTYTWGWRKHPPRAQAVENSHKRIPPSPQELMAEESLLQHPTWPKLPPFARLRIIDHERFVFDGLAKTQVDQEADSYFRNFGTLNSSQTRESLKCKFKALSGVPFFHPTKDAEGGPIARIGDLAPAKRMWRVFRTMRDNIEKGQNPQKCLNHILEARLAFLDWKDRNNLPSGIEPDPCSDFTIMYVNNTIYGQSRHGGLRFDEWRTRVKDPKSVERQKGDLRLAIINGDYFLHGYINPDFGGKSGWENQFKPTLPLGGTGSFFSFGRFNWRFNTEPGAIGIPPAVMLEKKDGELKDYVHEGQKTFLSKDGEPIYDGTQPAGVRPFVHRVWIRYNYEPSRRLRFYQFDPLHHDVAIYSIH